MTLKKKVLYSGTPKEKGRYKDLERLGESVNNEL